MDIRKVWHGFAVLYHCTANVYIFSVTISLSLSALSCTVDKDLLFKPLNKFSAQPSFSLSLTHTHIYTVGGVKPHRAHSVFLIAVGKVTLCKPSAAVCGHLKTTWQLLYPLHWHFSFQSKALSATQRALPLQSRQPYLPAFNKVKSCCTLAFALDIPFIHIIRVTSSYVTHYETFLVQWMQEPRFSALHYLAHS